ncbi:deferrochelatase/peroxidase EfeB [Kocuria rhizophila]|uniref:iron uptake transporter deferrochelatase/peroxidase subunit n=1 Tax=Kocuria rhizophila TaxID=72000 RepID=UPI0028D6484C|nr:iron uptake transporter deferrochelatase/peroxidase subunit [Kocuria rhizophila]MDV5999064.1 deferrochelatase/peroxidase EfeB [Kocuria rhizophila]
MATPHQDVPARRAVSRRALFGTGAGALAVGAGLGLAGPPAVAAVGDALGTRAPDDVVAFHGAHQAGIVTPAQDRLCFASLNVLTKDRAELVALLRKWTAACRRITQGLDVTENGFDGGSDHAPPQDTGEAHDLSAAHLTVTVGFGRSLFRDGSGKDRFGLAEHLPEALIELPHFPGDRLEEHRTGGDLCIQACADDPQVAVHAVHNLIRMGFGIVSTRWMQLGFGRTSSTSTEQVTPRNLFGFKDGTANLKAEDPDQIDQHVWVRDGSWLDGGTYLVARRIRMILETWDRESLMGQEKIIGRTKGAGAPLSGGEEFTPVDLSMAGSGHQPIIPVDSHVRLAHPDSNGGVQMLRRGYNYADGTDSVGNMDVGLFFIAMVKDPATGYVPMQNRLARQDALSEYLRHTGSGLFAVPAGLSEDPEDHFGRAIFEA